MCGLAGVALGPKDRTRSEIREIADLFTELFVLNEPRGRDASGLAIVDRDGGFILLKRAVAPSTLIETEIYAATLAEIGPHTSAILGHTRRPTRGSTRDPLCNQPIRRGGTIGTHNGTILNADWLGYPRMCAVDSEVLVQAAEESASNAEFVRRIGRMTGYLAAAIVKTEDPRRVQLLRGNMPLAIHRDDRLDATFWSSLADHLDDVFGAARVIGPMTGLTIRDGRLARRYRVAMRVEGEWATQRGRRWTSDAESWTAIN